MKINDIILKEELDQKEADMVYQGLIASGEEYDKMVAREFQITRNDPRHTSVDTAQQAAETRARNKMKKSIDKIKKAEDDGNLTIDPKKDVKKRDYSDKFYGNQYVDRSFVADLNKYMPIIAVMNEPDTIGKLGKVLGKGYASGKGLSALLDPGELKSPSKLGKGFKTT